MSVLGALSASRSVRLRLLTLALLPLVVLLPVLLGVTMWRWIDKYDELLLSKVASDLRIAEQYFLTIEVTQAAQVQALARSVTFAEAQAAGPQAVGALLRQDNVRRDLDFLVLYDPASAAGAGALEAIAARASADAPSAGLAVLEAAELEAIAPDLVPRAAVDLVPTAAARSIDRTVERRGMVMLGASVVPGSGRVLIGGRLLNRDLDIIDTMNALIYREREDIDARIGTTTLFLDDVRISTNVRLFEGARALGTRVSEVVFDQVMGRGTPWLDRAFVVNEWYVSGYVPLTDITGARVGMLYTGFLEAPFAAQRNATILWLLISFLVVLAVTVPLFLRLARGIFAPLEKMTATMTRIERGTLDARIGPVETNDEIGEVAEHLDRLLDQVQERDAELRHAADNLNDLVDKRTAELREASKKLEDTFAQLVMSEKLASIGEITAGVAHEINNPVAVIQGNLEILRASLSAEAQEDLQMELDLIDAQTHRIHTIVGKLLDFTRPGELSDATSRVDVRKVVEDTLLLVAPDMRKHHVEVVVAHGDAPNIHMVETELQQIIINLAVNAAQAMDDGGTLTIKTGAQDREGVPGALIEVSDTGPGIPRERLDQVFDPFFSTKLAEGSGLGLSISQALVRRVDGLITVRSTPGLGTTFFVWCPAADNLSPTSEPA
ncbi:MAG: cache domain-containing protein [Pseudomonadota bacterium]